MVADDNADMREYIVRLLGQHWTVEAVSDGLEALAAARRAPPDLLISDVMMPHLDGFGLLRELRLDPRTASIPTILLSARAGEEATAEGLRAGARRLLGKTFFGERAVDPGGSAVVRRPPTRRACAPLRSRSERGSETIFRESPAAICMLRGPDLRVELANPLILQVWGKTAAIIGQPFADAVPEIRGQGFLELLHAVRETGIPSHGKEALARLDRAGNGVLRDAYFDFVYAPFPSPDGTIDAVFVHAYEVTRTSLGAPQLRPTPRRSAARSPATQRRPIA